MENLIVDTTIDKLSTKLCNVVASKFSSNTRLYFLWAIKKLDSCVYHKVPLDLQTERMNWIIGETGVQFISLSFTSTSGKVARRQFRSLQIKKICFTRKLLLVRNSISSKCFTSGKHFSVHNGAREKAIQQTKHSHYFHRVSQLR